MKRETIADKAIWKGAKNYIMNAWNIEGVQFSEPQLKIQGIEAVRSSTPKVCRSNIKKSLSIIMNKDEETLQKFIADFKHEFMKLGFEEVAFPRGMKGMDKYKDRHSIYTKGTPIHVRGALLYNHHCKRMGLDKKYQPIRDGDKIKFVYVRTPNPLQEDVIAFSQHLPKEFGLEAYIDYDKQFEKVFLDALQIVIEPLGWKTQEESSLEDFFG